MTSPATAYKFPLTVSGNIQDQSPNYWPTITPSLIKNNGTEYTSTEVATILADDANSVSVFVALIAGTTGRSNHCFVYKNVPSLSALSFLTRFRHLNTAQELPHTEKMYIWNNGTEDWDEIATSTATGNPRTFSGGPIASLDDYVNDGGEMYVLHWDYDGVYRIPTCVHADTMITLDGGARIPARDIRPGDMVIGRQDGIREARKVVFTSYHYPESLGMVRVVAGPDLWYCVVDKHHCPIGLENEYKRADNLTIGELIPDSQGNLWPILEIEKETMVCDVVDLEVRHDVFEVNGTGDVGLLTRTIA